MLLRVSHDVSVIGFDDIEVSGYFVPALTTISQPRVEIGRVAATKLFDLIKNDGESNVVEQTSQLDVTLVVRESTAPPPSS